MSTNTTKDQIVFPAQSPQDAGTPAPRGKRGRVVLLSVLGGAVLLTGIGIGASNSTTTTTTVASPEVTKTVEVPAAAPAPAAPAPAAPVAPAPAAPAPAAPAPAPPAPAAPAAPAPAAPSSVLVPNAIGKDYQTAQDLWRAAGLHVTPAIDALGAHRVAVLDANWVVLSQSPAPGSSVPMDTAITATIKKFTDK
jgi:hypothetical protein